MHTSSPVEIRDIVIRGDEITGTHDIHLRHEDWNTGGGREDSAVMVRLTIDSDGFELVQVDLGQATDPDGLDRSIAALTAVRGQLAVLYDGQGA